MIDFRLVFLYLNTLKTPLAKTPNATITRLPPRPTPNTSRWNIDGVGSPTRGADVGHVDFMLFVSISLTLHEICNLHRFTFCVNMCKGSHYHHFTDIYSMFA